jgi:hypothetical protein
MFGSDCSLLKNMAKFGGPAVLFHFGFAIVWFAILFFPVTLTIYKKSYAENYLVWRACLYSTYFQNRLGVVTEDADRLWRIAKDECGEIPSYKQNISGGDVSYQFVVFILAGQSIVITLVFLPSRIMKYLEASKGSLRGAGRYEMWRQRMHSLSAAIALGHRPFAAVPESELHGGHNNSILAAVMNILPATPKIANLNLSQVGGSASAVAPRFSADSKNVPRVLQALSKLDNPAEQKSVESIKSAGSNTRGNNRSLVPPSFEAFLAGAPAADSGSQKEWRHAPLPLSPHPDDLAPAALEAFPTVDLNIVISPDQSTDVKSDITKAQPKN